MEKMRKAIWRFVFSHTMLTIVLLVIQIMLLFVSFYWLTDYAPYVITVCTLLGAVLVIHIINSDENPAFQLVWMILFCAFPVLGAALYLLIKLDLGTVGVKNKLVKQEKETENFIIESPYVLNALKQQDPHFINLAYYMKHIGHATTYRNSQVKYYPLGDDKFVDMLEDLKQAEKYIFLEYFIIEEGQVWNQILDILKEKVRKGVEVRVMYDGMCSLSLLPFRYPKKLTAMGIKARQFAPIKPLLSTSQNNRDHRKILIIDGKVAYTGGVNLADEYMNQKVRFGHWKDTAIRIEGDAVLGFLVLFLQMWDVGRFGKKENYEKFITAVSREQADKNSLGFVIPYGDGPHRKASVAETVYMDILHQAVRYVHIMTPYLIIDNEMMEALCFAANRGVDVKLILPHIPDKKILFWIAHTYYPALIRAGVQIYEYTPGFVHAKSFVSDDERAVVGTVNLDYRSFYLHFECGAYIYQNPVVRDVEKDYQETLGKCQLITLAEYNKISWMTKVLGRVFRLFAPLM